MIATRYWIHRVEEARRIKGDPRASVRQLEDAICGMQLPFPRVPLAEFAHD